jgi:amidase
VEPVDFGGFDVLLCPVAAIPAFRHGERRWGGLAYPEVFSYCQVFNYWGHPAVAVPAGRSPEGLPIGVQIVARPGEDETALAVAERLEQALR